MQVLEKELRIALQQSNIVQATSLLTVAPYCDYCLCAMPSQMPAAQSAEP